MDDRLQRRAHARRRCTALHEFAVGPQLPPWQIVEAAVFGIKCTAGRQFNKLAPIIASLPEFSPSTAASPRAPIRRAQPREKRTRRLAGTRWLSMWPSVSEDRVLKKFRLFKKTVYSDFCNH
jgi:hypothetical protein